MSRKTMFIAAAISVVLVAGIATWFATRGDPSPQAQSTDLYVEPSVAPADPDEEASALEEAVENGEVDEADAGGHNHDQDDLHHEDGEGGDAFIAQYENVAESFVLEWLDWDTAEPAAARQARLAPYLADGVTLSERPNLYTNAKGNILNLESTITVDRVIYTGFDSETDSGATWVFSVNVQFTANYKYNNQSQNLIDQRKWYVSLPSTGDIKVLALDEPPRW